MTTTTFTTELENQIINLTDFDYNTNNRLQYGYEHNGRNKYFSIIKQNWADDTYNISFYSQTNTTSVYLRTSDMSFSINEVKSVIKKVKANSRGAKNIYRKGE